MENKTMDKQKMVGCHTKAAEHHKKAADHHLEAAKHLEAGNHEKALSSAHMAHGHTCYAAEHATEASKCCAGIECKK